MHMDKAGEEGKAGRRPDRQDASARSGQSGEGARSALAHLIQQERKRDAQLPRDDGDAGAPATTRRE